MFRHAPLPPESAADVFGPQEGTERLARFAASHRRLFVLTGAGCSTGSGIPDYRDAQGRWKRSPPMTWQIFSANPSSRQRYWARSFAGWPTFASATVNGAHLALTELQRQGRLAGLVTQNVDGLHQSAGSDPVIDLHGRLDRIRCIDCGGRWPRAAYQQRLARANPGWAGHPSAIAPDGDADLDDRHLAGFVVPGCADCGGTLRPDVVFFGETVPREVVDRAFALLEQSDAMLIVGSSLTVHSGYRFARRAAELGIPLAAVNRGVTRADPLLDFRVDSDAGEALMGALRRLPGA